jgi:uncharacterized protein (TIGR00725 family)
MKIPIVAVVGGGIVEAGAERVAEEVGRLLAERGAIVLTGGLGGVMAAACRGATHAGGTTVGLLPGDDRGDANEWVGVAIATGMGEARNALVARAADAMIAVGGEFGTLSEIALALKLGRPVIGIDTWEIRRSGVSVDPILRARDAAHAVELALARVD